MAARSSILIVSVLAILLLASCGPATGSLTPGVDDATLILPGTDTPTPIRTPTPIVSHSPAPTAPSLVATEAPTPVPSLLSLEDQVGIYTAVIRQLYTVDHTFGQDPQFPVVYLAAEAGNAVDPAVEEGVLAALSSPSVRFEWMKDSASAPRDENGAVEGGGSIVSVGTIQPLTENKVTLDASIYIAPLAAGGYTYVLEKIDGVWQITDGGMQWIS